MRFRLILVVVAVLATSLVAAVPAVAHDTDDPKEPYFHRVLERTSAVNDPGEGAARCRDGTAARTYPCENVDLLSRVSLDQLHLSFVNDMWGWTDPATGKDYALVGGTEGTAFVDISSPRRPDVVAFMPAHALDPNRPFWRDLKVYKDHVFVVSEQTDHGMQVFDLTRLRGVTGDTKRFRADAHYDNFSTTHNLEINEATGYAYAVGTNTCDAGLHMIDISDPTNPVFSGCFRDHGYIHDTQCVIYEGPDVAYQGHEICFNSNATVEAGGFFNAVSIVDVTNKRDVVSLSRVTYELDGYSHHGWLTPDQQYFLHDDELDEVFHGIGTRTRIWDVRDLDAPFVNGFYDNPAGSIGHNLYTEGQLAYASNYTSGLRVYDTSQVAAGQLSEVGFFDLYPENNNATFEGGTWSNYAYFAQEDIVAASSIDRGLFILRPRVSAGVAESGGGMTLAVTWLGAFASVAAVTTGLRRRSWREALRRAVFRGR